MLDNVAPSPSDFGLTETLLGPEALAFATAELNHSGEFGNLVVASLPLAGRQIVTFLPPDALPSASSRFDDSCAVQFQQMHAHTHDFSVPLTMAHLARSSRSIVVMNTLARPTDPWIANTRPKYFTYKDEVYLYLDHGDLDAKTVQHGLAQGGAYPGIVAFTFQPLLKRISPGKVVSPSHLKHLARHTVSIMIEAYDQDGFLLWSDGRIPAA